MRKANIVLSFSSRKRTPVHGRWNVNGGGGLRPGIAPDPEDVESLRRRAALYRELGQPEQSVRDSDEVLRLEPGDPSVREERRQAVMGAEAQGR